MTAAREAEKLVADIKAVVRDAEHLLEAGGSELNEKARERLEKAISAARESCRRAEDTMKEAVARADEVVRKHPYESIAVALGIGLLAGILLRRR